MEGALFGGAGAGGGQTQINVNILSPQSAQDIVDEIEREVSRGRL